MEKRAEGGGRGMNKKKKKRTKSGTDKVIGLLVGKGGKERQRINMTGKK